VNASNALRYGSYNVTGNKHHIFLHTLAYSRRRHHAYTHSERLSLTYYSFTDPRGWMAELAMLADIQRTVYSEKVTRQLHVIHGESQGKFAGHRPTFTLIVLCHQPIKTTMSILWTKAQHYYMNTHLRLCRLYRSTCCVVKHWQMNCACRPNMRLMIVMCDMSVS